MTRPSQHLRWRVAWPSYLDTRFWLVVPALVLDLLLTSRLPGPLRPASFGREVPAWLVGIESVLRVLVIAVPVLMPLPRREDRLTWAVYLVGLLAYGGAWMAEVVAAASAWSASAVGFTAVAWTSLIWLAGIGFRSRLRHVPGYRPWMYLLLAVLFTAVHTWHAGIVWARQG